MYKYLFLILAILLTVNCNSNKKAPPKPTDRTTQKADSTQVELRKIQNGVWIHTSYHTFKGQTYPSNGMVVQVQDSLYLIDPAWGEANTRILLQKIESQIGLPIVSGLATHFHGDRVAGVDILEAKGIEMYTHPKTPALAKAEGNAVPDHTLATLNKPGATVSFGPLEVFYPGPAHSLDNIMVWVPKQQILYGGCAIRNAQVTTLGNTADADLSSWPKAIRRAQKAYPQANIVVPGHGAVGGPELLDHTLALFKK